MHELSLAESVMQIIQESATTQHFRRVTRITLEVGELAAVEADALRFCFDAVSNGTIAEGAALHITPISGLGRCNACGATMTMRERYGLCEQCGDPHLEIIAGDRMQVKELTVE